MGEPDDPVPDDVLYKILDDALGIAAGCAVCAAFGGLHAPAATAALVIGPGATEQVLHREEDPFQFFKPPRPNMIVASMWAMTDFTAANGGTHLVPGSHRWPQDRVARADEVVAAEMQAGSVLLWMGGTLHGAGANRVDEWRYGVFLSYSLGWLRQEENQFIDVPPNLARTLPKQVRDLCGYRMHLGLGYSDVPPKTASEEQRSRLGTEAD